MLVRIDAHRPTYLGLDANARAALIRDTGRHFDVSTDVRDSAQLFARFIEDGSLAVPAIGWSTPPKFTHPDRGVK